MSFLARSQNLDGGFPLTLDGASNAQSTAYVVQAAVAAGRDPGRLRRRGSRSALAYLRSLVTSNGSVRYSRTSAQTPVWVTAQALAALERRPLPLAPVPRRRARADSAPLAARSAPTRASAQTAGRAPLVPLEVLLAAHRLGIAAGMLIE
jgi:energy-coupling factor transport system substrate-specific component